LPQKINALQYGQYGMYFLMHRGLEANCFSFVCPS